MLEVSCHIIEALLLQRHLLHGGGSLSKIGQIITAAVLLHNRRAFHSLIRAEEGSHGLLSTTGFAFLLIVDELGMFRVDIRLSWRCRWTGAHSLALLGKEREEIVVRWWYLSANFICLVGLLLYESCKNISLVVFTRRIYFFVLLRRLIEGQKIFLFYSLWRLLAEKLAFWLQ